jgi:hypothetical protein
MIVDLELRVKIEKDRANANEIFRAVTEAVHDVADQLATVVIESYEERLIEILCEPSGLVAKKGLGGHEVKGGSGERCHGRRFKRAGRWSEVRHLRGPQCGVEFRPRMIECERCGKRLTPILEGLELGAYQGRTDSLVRRVTEAVADTSYRRGANQLEVFGEKPIAKSTAHQWVANVELPVQASEGAPILAGDGTGFKRQPGKKGEVRFVLEIGEDGGLHPLGVWAGTSWEVISREVKARQQGQAQLFISDGERGLEKWLGSLAEDQNRCHWHMSRDSGFALWQDKVSLSDRKAVRSKMSRLLAIEIPAEDVEQVSDQHKEELRRRIKASQKELDALHRDFESKGYEKAATYLANARDRLFKHLELWLKTGIAAPRTTSIVENLIRELVRRLKKVGWNWSDKGATRMGRIVMIRRYDEEAWHRYWEDRMNMQGRCTIELTKCEVKKAA